MSMTPIIQIVDPIRIYEVKGQVCTLATAYLEGSVSNNQQVVAAVSGQKIRVMGWDAQNVGAALANVLFKSASAGTTLIRHYYLSVLDFIDKPVIGSGYFETKTGEGLYADIAGDLIYLTVYYITYTP